MPQPGTVISCVLLALFVAVGCERESTPQPSPEPSTSDGDHPPARIVSLAPSVTETIFALGEGDRVVAVTRFCDHPPSVTDLPEVGGLTDVDVELVLSLEPDLVVGVDNKTAGALDRTLKRADVETLFLPVENLADVRGAIETLGARLGAEPRAAKLVEPLKLEAGEVSDGPKVLVLLGKEPWIAAGPGTFADEIVRGVGGRNVLQGSSAAYPTLDAERLGSLAPDVVIDTSFGERAELPLGAEARVVRVDPALMRPGPRLADAIDRFRTALEGRGDGD